MDDAELVAGVLGGDREAFARIYDRYANRLHDFCHSVLRDRAEAADAMQDTFVLAAQRLHQLRDASKLRPWLFAIARHESLRRARARRRGGPAARHRAGGARGGGRRARRRAVPTDELGEVGATGFGPEDEMRRTDLTEIVWSAAEGLSERDRVLLDLHLRQGLDGQELADAIGVTPGHAYVLMNRLRAQVERSLGALLVARLGRDDCNELAGLLRDWDGRFSVLIRKRVARHVDRCEICSERRKTVVSPLALLAAAPLIPATSDLREAVLDRFELVRQATSTLPPRRPGARWRHDGFPPAMLMSRAKRGLVAAAVFAVVAGIGGPTAIAVSDRDGGTEVVAEAPSTTGEAAVTTDEPATTSTAETSTTTTSVAPTSTTVRSGGYVPPTDPPAATTVPTPPVTTAPVTATTTTATPPTTTTTTTDAPTTTTTTTTAPPDEPPTVSIILLGPPTIYYDNGCLDTIANVHAEAGDDRGIAGVRVVWESKYSGSGSATMSEDNGIWYGNVGPFDYNGYTTDTVTVTVVATDSGDHEATDTGSVELVYTIC